LFRAAPSAQPRPVAKQSAVEERLRDVHPDELTPIDALRLVYEIKGLL
jgi:DNA mismatch repair protein MutS